MSDELGMDDVRVLIVDDSVDVRRLLKAIVQRHDQGWHVAGEADTGESAITMAGTSQPDLVLLDVSMPVMDGIEALPLIRQAAPSARVVVLTGFPSEALHDDAVRAGAHGYIEKADLVASLIPRLESILVEGRAPGHSAGP